jgi:hypothetical protein
MLNVDIPHPISAKIRAYARMKGIAPSDAATALITQAFDHLAARTRGAEALNRRRTKAERIEHARRAVTARWERKR